MQPTRRPQTWNYCSYTWNPGIPVKWAKWMAIIKTLSLIHPESQSFFLYHNVQDECIDGSSTNVSKVFFLAHRALPEMHLRTKLTVWHLFIADVNADFPPTKCVKPWWRWMPFWAIYMFHHVVVLQKPPFSPHSCVSFHWMQWVRSSWPSLQVRQANVSEDVWMILEKCLYNLI